jgi:hypothetical protein
METFTLDKDIKVFCVQAQSFPDGVMKAHDTLHALVPDEANRRFFGISRPGSGGAIIYKAAAEELDEGELSRHNLESFIISKGVYIYIDVPNFMQHLPDIGNSFRQLLADPRIDPNGACVEWYMNDADCRCMVKLK